MCKDKAILYFEIMRFHSNNVLGELCCTVLLRSVHGKNILCDLLHQDSFLSCEITGHVIWFHGLLMAACGDAQVSRPALCLQPLRCCSQGNLFSSFSGTRNTRSFAQSHSFLHQNLSIGTKPEFCPFSCLVPIYLVLNPFFPSLCTCHHETKAVK